MKKAALFFVGTALLLQGCRSGESVNLRFNFQPGEKYGYSTVTKQHMTAAGLSVDQNIKMENTYEISAADGTNKKMTTTFNRIVMQMAGNGMAILYDSKNPDKQDLPLKFMGGLIDRPFNMIVSDKGEILSVTGLSDIVSSLADSASPDAAVMKNQVSRMFNDTAVKNMLQQSFFIYPDKPVRPGDTWKKEVAISGMVSMSMANTFKLDSVSGGIAHLQINSVIKATPVQDGPMKDMHMDGTQSGTLDVLISSGMLTGGKIHQSIKGSVKSMDGKDMPIEVSSDIEMSGKKL